MTPDLTIAVPASIDEAELDSTLTSLQVSVERCARHYEILVAVNGPGTASPAAEGVRRFAAAAGLPLVETPEASDAAVPGVRLLRLGPRSKVLAWNAIVSAARAPVIVFADADVRVTPEAIGTLVDRLEREPSLAVVAGRERPLLDRASGMAARVAALPYRFDFGTIPGRFYALRLSAHHEPMPPTVLHEDAYLTVRLGPKRFVKEPRATVYLRPPDTWREYLRQRLRNEVGRLQLEQQFPELYHAHGFGGLSWRTLAGSIPLRDYPLVACTMAARLYARVGARVLTRRGFPTGWSILPSTKRWTPDVAARVDHDGTG